MLERASLCAMLATTLALLGPSAGLAVEIVQKNDSTIAGTPSTVADVFIPGETVASRLPASCDGDIVGVRVYWASQFGGAPAQLEDSITLFSDGFPTPGAPLLNQGAVNAVIPLPTLIDGSMNEFRFLDPPTNAVPLSVPVTAGQSFVIGLKLLNQSAGGGPFAPSVVYDQDGCQSLRNAVDVIPGGWNDACPLGVTGDWVIRAVVDCQPSAVPAMGGPALALLLAGVAALGVAAIARRTAND
jgi:hypothetical protein